MVAHNYEKIDHRAQKEEESIRNGPFDRSKFPFAITTNTLEESVL